MSEGRGDFRSRTRRGSGIGRIVVPLCIVLALVTVLRSGEPADAMIKSFAVWLLSGIAASVVIYWIIRRVRTRAPPGGTVDRSTDAWDRTKGDEAARTDADGP